MSAIFSPSLTVRSSTWTIWLAARTVRASVYQYELANGAYRIWFYDGPELYTCVIWQGVVPVDIIAGGYSQAQNDADKADFLTDFEPYANRSIDNAPSLIIASSIKSGGSANLGVDGSVTPVVFEYNPPNNYDIEINALSFLFESTGTMGFGNVFVHTSIATLANGLLLEVKAGDNAATWQNMRRTRDLVEISQGFDLIAGTTNFMRVRVQLPKALRLYRDGTYVTPEYLRVTVRDDLSTIGFGEAHFLGVKL
jgi:hypothetical protein